VELDLSSAKGRVPVELMGRSLFPPVGALPYQLTLSGHGFYSFRLASDVEPPAWHEERQMPLDLPVLVLLEAGWHALSERPEAAGSVRKLLWRRTRQRLERQVIPRFMRAQPWFLDRDASVLNLRFSQLQTWSADTGSWLMATVAVSLAGGRTHHYALPLALAWEGAGADLEPLLPGTLAKVRLRDRMGVLFDASWDDQFLRAVVAGMERGGTLPFGQGSLEFASTGAHPGLAGPAEAATVTRNLSANGQLRVNFDDRLWLKGYRWLLEGTHPELELSRFLTETALFTRIPQLAGTMEYVDPRGQRSTLAILERYMENQGDAWSYTLNYLERFLESIRATPEPPEAHHTAYLGLMHRLGQRTAEFHRGLALPDEAGAFGTELASAADLAGWVARTRLGMEAMFELLARELPQLPGPTQAVGGSLLAARPRLFGRILRIGQMRMGAMKTRYHGDYQLDQVWLTGNDFLIANYGGEPGLSWAERRQKHTPLRDVAGMLLSLSEAGDAALELGGGPAEVRAALAGQVEDWGRLARRAFYRSYRRAMSGHPSCPAAPAATEALVVLSLTELAAARATSALAGHAATVGTPMRLLVQLARRGR
jgi:maltose alpha-D-glucosyltransferase/alpha-amylase